MAGFFVLAFLALGTAATPAAAESNGWHAKLEDGVAAAEKSGKPILLITGWKRTL